MYRVGNQEELRDRVVECTNVLKQMSKQITVIDSPNEIAKVQSIIRQVELNDLIINQLLKQLYFDKYTHRKLFDATMTFLFNYAMKSPTA